MVPSKNILFWQPKRDILSVLTGYEQGIMITVLLNYTIWYFLLFISFLLVSKNPNMFWQILFAMIVSEVIEKWGKKKKMWGRPYLRRKDRTPPGLISRWYDSGSFPSGHTIKAVFFFLLVLSTGAISPFFFLAVAVPLIIFRILIGFHYPIDILGGIIIGVIIWYVFSFLQMPPFLNQLIHDIFSFVFYYPLKVSV